MALPHEIAFLELIRLMGPLLCAPTDSIQDEWSPCHIIVSERRTKGRIVRGTKINASRLFFPPTVHRHCNMLSIYPPTLQHHSAQHRLPLKSAENCLHWKRICVNLTVCSFFLPPPPFHFYTVPQVPNRFHPLSRSTHTSQLLIFSVSSVTFFTSVALRLGLPIFLSMN